MKAATGIYRSDIRPAERQVPPLRWWSNNLDSLTEVQKIVMVYR